MHVADTNLNELGLIFVIIMGALVLVLPRRYVPLPFIVTCCYITIGQRFTVGVFHFDILRVLVFCGWLRMFIRREFSPIGLNRIDKALIVWVSANAIINVFLLHNGSDEAMVNRLGFIYDVIGLYFLFRLFIRDFLEVETIIKFTAVAIAPLAAMMVLETITGRNVFFIFGGVLEMSWIRDGSVRAQGPFRNPINAGTFGATILPLFVGLWFQEKRGKFFCILGVGAAATIIAMARSGGPLSACIFGAISLVMWKFQRYIRYVLWGLVLLVIYMQIFMTAPIWYLAMRISNIVGGGGWHRAYLVDQAFKHIDEWWLFGTTYTAHWMPYALTIDPTQADITNQYVVEGVRGGLLTMFLFIAVIVFAFRGLWTGLVALEEGSLRKRFTLWTMGSAMVVHTMTFTSTSYFDQMIVVWYMLLAMVSWASNLAFESEEPEEPEAAEAEYCGKKGDAS